MMVLIEAGTCRSNCYIF